MKKTPHHLLRRALTALTLSAVLTPLPVRAINAIINENFTGGTDFWSLNLGAAAASLDNSEGYGRVRFTNGGTSRSAVNLDQPLGRPLLVGVEYLIEFDAKADVAKPIDILLRSSTGIHSATYGYNVGTTFARKSIPYIHSGTDVYDAKLSFRIGGNNTTVYIDNVVVTRKGQPSSLITKTGSIPTPAAPWSFPNVSVPINGTSPTTYKSFNVGAYDFSYAGYNYGEREAMIGLPPTSTHTFPVALPGADNDITDEINAALLLASNAGGGTVVIPNGTFFIGSGMTGKCIIISSDNTVLKGGGMGNTKLVLHSSYHASSFPSTLSDRQTAAFGNGVITFARGTGGSWYDGSTASNVATVPIASSPIPINATSITVTDPSATLANYTGPIVIRQIMSRKFNETYAWLPNNQKKWRWSDYQKDASGNYVVGSDGKNIPLFSDGSFSLTYFRKIVSKTVSGTTRTLVLDVPLPYELVPQEFADTDPNALPNPDHQPITVAKKSTALLTNCGLQDLTLDAEDEAGVGTNGIGTSEDAAGCTLMVTGVYNGLFKNIDVVRFRTLAIATSYPVNTSFINCTASNAINCGGNGSGYGFYIKGQNLLYKNCNAINVRHGFTTASSQTSNVVIKNCSADTYRFHSAITTGGESVDDTHLQYAHGILWDNHHSDEAGLLMVNRSEQSNQAWETCGWGIVWNYENEGDNTRLAILNSNGTTTYKDIRHNLIGITPTQFGLVIGAHAGPGRGLLSVTNSTSKGIRVSDGYTRINDDNMQPEDWGTAITTTSAQVGNISQRVMFEHTGLPVAESIYDIQFAQRAKVLSALPVLP